MQAQQNSNQRRSRRPQYNYNSRELRLIEKVLTRNSGPPVLVATQPIHRSVQLVAAAAQGEFDVLVSYLMFFQCVATSATVVANMTYAVRIKRVRIWFVAPSQNTTTTATIEWNAGSTGFLVHGVSLGIANTSTTEPVCLDSRPPTESLGAWYQGGPTSLTNSLFSCSIPAGGTIQIDYDWVPAFTEQGLGNATVSGAATGTVYCRGMNSNVMPIGPLNPII